VSDGEHARMERRLDDIETRIREIERVESPFIRQLVSDVREVQHAVGRMDIEGTRLTQLRMHSMDEAISGLRTEVSELRKDRDTDRENAEKEGRANRRAIGIVILAAALSFAASFILNAVVR
jgi:hypothetical protein